MIHEPILIRQHYGLSDLDAIQEQSQSGSRLRVIREVEAEVKTE